MRETWYKLENGDVVHPRHIAPDAKGKLHHKDGVAVAMKGDVPHTVGVDADAVSKEVEAPSDREVTAERPKRTYKTREAKVF